MEPPKHWPDDAVRQLHQLERKNGELLARLMKVHGETDQITDVGIQESFSKLRDAIFSWIQAVHHHLRDDQRGWHFSRDVLLRQVRRNATPGEQNWMGWLAEYNSTTCILVILSLAIWHRLDEDIFRSDEHDKDQTWFPIGIPGQTQVVFKKIFKSIKATADGESMPMFSLATMSLLTDHATHNPVAANRWKSTTLSAFVRTNTARREKREQTIKAVHELSHHLRQIMHLEIRGGRDPLADFLPRLQKNVVECAADLYQRISCSRYQYSLEVPKFQRGQNLSEADMSKWDLKNVKDWIDVTSEDDVKGVFRCLFPGIRRRSAGSAGDLSVVKPLVLVYDDSVPDPPFDSSEESDSSDSGSEDSTSDLNPSKSDTSEGDVSSHTSSPRSRCEPEAATEYAEPCSPGHRSPKLLEQCQHDSGKLFTCGPRSPEINR